MGQCKGLGSAPATASARAWKPQAASLLFFSSSLLVLIQARGRTRCLPVALQVNQVACRRIIFSGEKEDSDASPGHTEDLRIPASCSYQTDPPLNTGGETPGSHATREQSQDSDWTKGCLHSRALSGSPCPAEAKPSQSSAFQAPSKLFSCSSPFCGSRQFL